MGKEAIWIRQEQGWEEIQSYWKFEIHTKNPSVCKDIYWKCTSYNLKVSSSLNQCYVMKHILIFLNHRVLDALFTDYQNWNMLGSRFSLTFSADISQPININYRSALTSPLPLPAFVLSSIPFSILLQLFPPYSTSSFFDSFLIHKGTYKKLYAIMSY